MSARKLPNPEPRYTAALDIEQARLLAAHKQIPAALLVLYSLRTDGTGAWLQTLEGDAESLGLVTPSGKPNKHAVRRARLTLVDWCQIELWPTIQRNGGGPGPDVVVMPTQLPSGITTEDAARDAVAKFSEYGLRRNAEPKKGANCPESAPLETDRGDPQAVQIETTDDDPQAVRTTQRSSGAPSATPTYPCIPLSSNYTHSSRATREDRELDGVCAESFASFKAVAPVESDTDWSKVVAPFRRASKKEGFRDYLARWLTYWRENDGLAETIRPSFWLNEGRYEDDTPDEHAGRSARGPSRRSNPYDELADLFDSSAADRPPLGLPATDRWPIGLPASD